MTDEERMRETLDVAMMDIELTHPSDWRSIQDPSRPYVGQPQTYDGERGKTEVRGLTMRDITDSLLIGMFRASGLPPEQYGSVYELDLGSMDPVAIAQNMTCEIERRMGIYPNVPALEWGSES